MSSIVFLTHADVVIDPNVPVPDWPLSEGGRARHARFSSDPAIADVQAIYSSAERKARDGAEIHAAALKCPHHIVRALHENDRTATGYLPKEEFEAVADAFFANPDEQVRGWERARDAQTRIVATVKTIADLAGPGDLLVVAHGGVGALLRAWLEGRPISRDTGQPGADGGNYLVINRETWTLTGGWRAIP